MHSRKLTRAFDARARAPNLLSGNGRGRRRGRRRPHRGREQFCVHDRFPRNSPASSPNSTCTCEGPQFGLLRGFRATARRREGRPPGPSIRRTREANGISYTCSGRKSKQLNKSAQQHPEEKRIPMVQYTSNAYNISEHTKRPHNTLHYDRIP